MNKYNLIRSNALRNTSQFLGEHSDILTGPVTDVMAQVSTTITEIDELSTSQVFGRGNFRAGSSERRAIANELRAVMREIGATAKVLDAGPNPGIADQFRMPLNPTYQTLLDSGRAFVEAVTPIKAAYIARGYEPDFVEKTTELVTRFNAATQRKFGGVIEHREGTIGLDEAIRRGMALIRNVDAILSRQLRHSNPALFQLWKDAKKLKGVHHTPEQAPAAATQPSQP